MEASEDVLMRPRWAQAMVHEDNSARMALFRMAFVLASLSHLWLADAWQLDWLPGNALYLVGLALLCWRPWPVAWALCAAGLAWPLLFGRDQLTQSVVLWTAAAVAAGLGARAGWRGGGAATVEAREGTLAWMQGVTILVYALAVFHKLNVDFLAPETSCAVHGLDELLVYYRWTDVGLPAWVLTATPWVVLATETAIAGLLVAGLRRPAWLLAVVFHIPLTLTMAPTFVFVMLVGHVAFVREAELAWVWGWLRRWWLLVAGTAVGMTAVSLGLHGAWPAVDTVPKEALLWGLVVVAAALLGAPSAPVVRRLSGRGRALLGVGLVAFGLHGLLPYTGLQFQHSAAMLSNLRVDAGCWNSVVVPESARLTDDYIRLDEAWLGAPGRIPEYEATLKDHLWSPPQLRQMRRNWCRPRVRPIRLEGTFRGRRFGIADLCDDGPWPFEDDGVFGVEVFPDYLRFQRNLERRCPCPCIH